MSLFKEKKSKAIKSNNIHRKTLDATHNEFHNMFKKEYSTLPVLKKKLLEIELAVEKLKSLTLKKMTDEQISLKFEYEEQIVEMKNKIVGIESKETEHKYLLDTSLLVFQYYESKDSTKKKMPQILQTGCHSVSPYKNTIIDFFKHSNPSIDDDNQSISKTDILNNYLTKVEKDYIPKKIIEQEFDICHNCKTEMNVIQSEGIICCTLCGKTEPILIDNEKPSYKDPPREISYFAYKRINHFNEWLAQFQAKESTDIPQTVYNEILLELKKERIINIKDLTPIKLREILKKLKKNKYYEHIPHIINKLNGVPPPVMTRKTEEELRRMFKEIQIPFHKFCPENRKNFLSYSYVLHKFVQLLELDEFLPCFMLLKSREKLQQQDQIWKKICEYLQWQYIPSL